jgi:hypothetical protein
MIRDVFIPTILLKTFLKRKEAERNGDKRTCICPIETLVCNCWTNDYTLDQLDAGKSVQGVIECVTICHLDDANLSLEHYKLPFAG